MKALLKDDDIRAEISLRVMQVRQLAEIGDRTTLDSDADLTSLSSVFLSIRDIADWLGEQVDENVEIQRKPKPNRTNGQGVQS